MKSVWLCRRLGLTRWDAVCSQVGCCEGDEFVSCLMRDTSMLKHIRNAIAKATISQHMLGQDLGIHIVEFLLFIVRRFGRWFFLLDQRLSIERARRIELQPRLYAF
nr:hypothetical protein CFP56_65919 [Quercus suber]